MPIAALTDLWTTLPGIAAALIGAGATLNQIHSGDLNSAAASLGVVLSGIVGIFSNSKGTAK